MWQVGEWFQLISGSVARQPLTTYFAGDPQLEHLQQRMQMMLKNGPFAWWWWVRTAEADAAQRRQVSGPFWVIDS